MDQQNTFIWEEHIPGGCHWSGIVRRGTTLRLVDVEGGANAAVLLFNQEEKLERYNMADTLKSQHTFRLTRGHACYSDMGRIFCCITADTAGWHDSVCGLSDAGLIRQKYGIARFQEQSLRKRRELSDMCACALRGATRTRFCAVNSAYWKAGHKIDCLLGVGPTTSV